MIYTITDDNLHIVNSYAYTKAEMPQALELAQRKTPTSKVWQRNFESLLAEWMVHNALYRLHLFRSHTADVDLNYPQRYDLVYRALMPLAELIIK